VQTGLTGAMRQRLGGDLDPATRAAISANGDACRARIPAFASRHFGLAGTLRLHRRALGLDLLRAPLNVLLVGPAFFVRVAAILCRRLGWPRIGDWLGRRSLFVETRLSREIATLVLEELLLVDGTSATPAWREHGVRLIAEYVAALATGLVLVQALTPSAVSLGPLLAQELAQKAAIESFWLGSWAGGIYRSWFPATASWTEIAATTVMAMGCFALVATFMGLVTDPLQQRLGWHRRRLGRLVSTIKRAAGGDSGAALGLPDPYIARVADLADWALMAMRLSR
jgi:hypothetical protein